MSEIDYTKQCEYERNVPIHQLNKLSIDGKKRNNFFPISILKAIFSSNGTRLDTILSSFNHLYLTYAGDKENTRLTVPLEFRRNGLIITYIDFDNNTISEIYKGNDRGDDEWKKDDNWISLTDYIKDEIGKQLGDLGEFDNIKEFIENAIKELGDDIVNEWLTENASSIITNWLNEQDISKFAEDAVNNYINSEDFTIKLNEVANNIFNNYINDTFIPKIDEYFNKIQEYIANNERVVANALSRHEEDINAIKIENNE